MVSLIHSTAPCSASSSRPEDRPNVIQSSSGRDRDSAGSYHTNDQARDADSSSARGDNSKPEVIKTPSGTGVNSGNGPRQTSGIINADGDKNSAGSATFRYSYRSFLDWLAFLVVAVVYSFHR